MFIYIFYFESITFLLKTNLININMMPSEM